MVNSTLDTAVSQRGRYQKSPKQSCKTILNQTNYVNIFFIVLKYSLIAFFITTKLLLLYYTLMSYTAK